MLSDGAGIYTEDECRRARALVRDLIRVMRSQRLYESDHPTVTEMRAGLRRRWDEATAAGPLTLRLEARRVLLGDEVVYQASGPAMVPGILYDHGIVGLVLREGIDPGEAQRFFDVLATEPGPAVDYASLFWEAELDHVQVLLDADEDDRWNDPPTDPDTFAREVEQLGDVDDPVAVAEFETLRNELGSLAAEDSITAPSEGSQDRFRLGQDEFHFLQSMLERDTYQATLLHTARVIHNMARESLTTEDLQTVETALTAAVGAIVSDADLTSAVEVTNRARSLGESVRDVEQAVGEFTLALFRGPPTLWAFLHGLDRHPYVDARQLAEFLANLGPSSAEAVGEWLIETRHPEVVTQAMRVYGDAGAELLIPLYRRSDVEGADRLAPALLELGTREALAALCTRYGELPESIRLRLVNAVAGDEDPERRRIVHTALDDEKERIRRAAARALTRRDAPAVAPLLRDQFERGSFDERRPAEVKAYFAVLAHIADAQIAHVFASQLVFEGFSLKRRKLSPLQEQCARALRKVRAPDARPILDDLRENCIAAVRQILDDPLGDLE